MAVTKNRLWFEQISLAICLAIPIAVVIAPATLSAQTSQAAYIGDAVAGEKIFKKCKACHKLGEKAKNATGPVLNNVIGRTAGSFKGYKYGKSMIKAGENGLVWNEERIFNYITNPKKYLRKVLGNKKAKAKMKFKLKKEVERKNVIAYLKRFSNPNQDKTQKDEMKTDALKTNSKTATYKALDNQICIQNKFPKTLLFTAEAKNGQRKVKMIEKNATLCVTADNNNGGTVGVFENGTLSALQTSAHHAANGRSEPTISNAALHMNVC
jgi:cytochrome c